LVGWNLPARGILLGGLLILLFVVGARAGELSLAQALQIASENSLAAAAASERAEAAAEQRREALGYLLPKVDLMEVAVRTEQPGEVFGMLMNRREAVMDMIAANSMMFANGQPYVADLVNPDPLNTYITRIQGEMPLFAGGMIWSRLRQAGLMAEAGELQAERDTRQVDFDVIRSWTDLAKAREAQDLLRRARETTRAHVRLARDYAGEGLLVASEVLRAEVYLAEMDELVTRAENGARLAEAALNFHLGIDRDTHHELGSMPALPERDGDLGSWTARALSARADLAAARLKLKAGDLEQRVALSAFLPTVGVQGRYDFFDDEIFGTGEGSYSLSGVLRLNVFSGGSDRARLSRARHEARAWRKDLARFEEGVKFEVQQAYGDYDAALLRHEAASRALGAGSENLRVLEERFRQGVAGMIELLDAETALRELEVRELTARFDSYLAAYRLRHAAGLEIT